MVLFSIGVLFIGIGAGVSFVEYSSFHYGGELKATEGKRTNKEVVLNWDEVAIGENKEFHFFNWTDEKIILVADENISVL